MRKLYIVYRNRDDEHGDGYDEVLGICTSRREARRMCARSADSCYFIHVEPNKLYKAGTTWDDFDYEFVTPDLPFEEDNNKPRKRKITVPDEK